MKNKNDNIEEEIRNDWFKNHKATLTGEEGFQRLMWQEPGTWMYGIKYVFSGNNVFISGDLGEAVYNLTCSATIDNIENFNLGYFTGKMSAFSRNKYDFNRKLAEKQLNEYWEEYDYKDNENYRELYVDILDAMSESSAMDHYHAWLMTVYNKSYDEIEYVHEILEYVWNFGQDLNVRLIAYWVGLQMAIEQLKGEA